MMQSSCLSTACFENMVIPLLRSSELLSRNVSPWSTLPSLRISPVLYRSISERVVFPASTCASIPIVRRFIKSPIKRFLLILAYQQKIFNRLQRKSPRYFNINSEHLMRIFLNRHILPQKNGSSVLFFEQYLRLRGRKHIACNNNFKKNNAVRRSRLTNFNRSGII